MNIIDQSERPKNIIPAGSVREATLEHDGHYLIFSTHNSPFEEELSIQLFSPEGQELERVDLYGAYSGGRLLLKDINDSSIEFTFWSEDRLRLTYQDEPKRVIFQPAGVHYSKRLSRRHLVVEGPFSQE